MDNLIQGDERRDQHAGSKPKHWRLLPSCYVLYGILFLDAIDLVYGRKFISGLMMVILLAVFVLWDVYVSAKKNIILEKKIGAVTRAVQITFLVLGFALLGYCAYVLLTKDVLTDLI